MRTVQLAPHLSDAALQTRLEASRATLSFSRWQVFYLIQVGGIHSAEVLSKTVGLSKASIYRFVQTYNHKGPEAIGCQRRGGRRRSYLTLQQEADLLRQVEQLASQGLIKTAQDIRCQAEKATGCKVSDDFLWDLLRRHGWKKKVPRPHHPGHDQRGQERFKKSSLPN